MVNVTEILIILLGHFVADFVCQTDKMAINKSTSNWWLTTHVAVYGLVMKCFAWGLVFVEVKYMIWWVVVNMLLHWGTDFFTSRLNSYLWQKGMRHWFFVGIGGDQLIHYACLFLTYSWFK